MYYVAQAELNKNLTLAAWIKSMNQFQPQGSDHHRIRYGHRLWLRQEDHRCRDHGTAG